LKKRHLHAHRVAKVSACMPVHLSMSGRRRRLCMIMAVGRWCLTVQQRAMILLADVAVKPRTDNDATPSRPCIHTGGRTIGYRAVQCFVPSASGTVDSNAGKVEPRHNILLSGMQRGAGNAATYARRCTRFREETPHRPQLPISKALAAASVLSKIHACMCVPRYSFLYTEHFSAVDMTPTIRRIMGAEDIGYCCDAVHRDTMLWSRRGLMLQRCSHPGTGVLTSTLRATCVRHNT
jgi:hypothetical protein